jgi:ubiquitin-like 1-activating enzyme E1 A
MSQISQADAKQYDRQIRLWGAQAQQRLSESRVLLIGLSSLGAEVAKNIVLAGIKSLCIFDPTLVTSKDSSNIFLFRPMDHGKRVSNPASMSFFTLLMLRFQKDLCAMQRLQDLNPLCQVSVFQGDALSAVADGDASTLQRFSVVSVCTFLPLMLQTSVNRHCRQAGVFFFSGAVAGNFGMFFTDLGADFSFSRDVTVDGVKQSMSSSAKFSSMSDVLDLHADKWNTCLKHAPQLFLCFLALQHLVHDVTSSSLHSCGTASVSLQDATDWILEKTSSRLALDPVLFEKLKQSVGIDFCPVGAIVGGILGQEIIKGSTGKEEPISNFFVYNADTSEGNTVSLL